MRVRAAHRFIVLAASILSCAHSKKNETIGTSAISDTPEKKPFGDIDQDAIDASVSPCADFYSYACGAWTKAARIPDDEGTWARSFSGARARDEKILLAILQHDAIEPPADDPYSAQLGDFFASCMDTNAIELRDDRDLTRLLDAIDTSDAESTARTVAHLHLLGVPALFVFEPERDLHDAHRVSAVIRQPPIAQPSDSIEEKIFAAFESRAVFHDPNAMPLVVDASAIAKMHGNFRWKTYFAELGIFPPTAIHVATPNYFSALDRILATTKPDALRATLRDELRKSLAPFSSRRLAQADVVRNFPTTGTRTLPDRSKFCTRSADVLLGDALAAPFVREASTEDDVSVARARVQKMRAAMQHEIDSLDWMDEPTRAAAKKKLASLSVAIGIPAEKPMFGAFDLERTSFLHDVVRLREIIERKKLAATGGASDPNAWRFSGTTANAYFDPRSNQMVIAAGILTAPIFDARDQWSFAFDDIVGHELTHALDRRFDENGNAANWWSEQTAERYRERVECVRRDLDAQSMIEKLDLHVSQILEESVADSGGLRAAYEAMTHSFDDRARDQAFFTAYAQLWCTELRPEALANFVSENPHAPPRVRVNRALADMPELADAFSCKDTDAMAKKPSDRCRVW